MIDPIEAGLQRLYIPDWEERAAAIAAQQRRHRPPEEEWDEEPIITPEMVEAINRNFPPRK